MPPKKKQAKKESSEEEESSVDYAPVKKSIQKKPTKQKQKRESSDREDDDEASISLPKPVRKVPQAKPKSSTKAKASASKSKAKQPKDEESDQNSEVQEKNTDSYKLYQKKETPPQDDPCRIFYETLYKENPQSLMAIKHCLDFGLIDDVEDIKKAFKLLEKSKTKQK